MSIRNIYIYLLVLLYIPMAQGQSDKELDALNVYVDFMNECVHGLTVAQIIFVNYNQDLNNYVDLASHKLNSHITNKEMGETIFDNPNINTQDDKLSALKLSVITKQNSGVLKNKDAFVLNELVTQITKVLNNLNALRFDVERVIATSDMSQKENVYKAYELLEKAVVYFRTYEHNHDKLARTLRRMVKYQYRPMDNIFYELHSASLDMFRELSKEKYDKLPKLVRRIQGALDNFSSQNLAVSTTNKLSAAELSTQVQGMLDFVNKHKDANAVPENYQQYGKNYYIHNHALLSYFNSISPGFVSKMNTMLKNSPDRSLKYDDRPILFKVIYPEKMEELESIATKNVINSDAFPLDLKLKMEDVAEVVSEPEEQYLELIIYDPNMKDRDTISLVVNGEKLLDQYELDFEEHVIRVPLELGQSAKIELHAHNTGIIPPNTIGLKYRFNGKGQRQRRIIKLEEGGDFIQKVIFEKKKPILISEM